MVDFPDYSAQEEPIATFGKAELLKKAGVKIMRFNRKTWGTENDVDRYNLIKEFITGKVVNVGLGMGTSADVILSVGSVTELISYELEQDIVDLFNDQHEQDNRHDIRVQDAHENKPDGNFDVILFELLCINSGMYLGAKDYLEWCKDHLTANGCVILEYNIWSKALIGELTGWDVSYISTTVNTLRPRKIWMQLKKQ